MEDTIIMQFNIVRKAIKQDFKVFFPNQNILIFFHPIYFSEDYDLKIKSL